MSLFGRCKTEQMQTSQGQAGDEQAIERYRYMLNTAPPETIEQAHAEAFARLTPEQRRLVRQRMRARTQDSRTRTRRWETASSMTAGSTPRRSGG